MVTQDAAAVPKVDKVKMKKLKKKKSKKKMKGTEKLESESEADKLDVEEKVYPLSHYISDQEELVNQMFLTIRGSKLEAMLPPVLKSIPLRELKRLCLHELRGMSKKRILCSINGQVMEGSSGSEEEEEEKEIANDDPKHNEADSKAEKRKPGDEQPPESFLHKKIKVEPGLEDSAGSEGKSVLELLELEMRARIIKTMLEKGDEGKKITEDAIAAVMQSAKNITGEDIMVGSEVAGAVADSKDDSQEKSGREVEGEDEMEERSRVRRRGYGRRTDRRRHHESRHDDKKSSSTRSKRDGSYSDDGGHTRSSKKQKELDPKHAIKKKKITRKEFEERMRRAKKNRTYRQRKSSEDEEKTNEDENVTENTKEDKDEKTGDKTDEKQVVPPEGNSIQDKAEVEVSEKEEGEIDSNEEEEGACSPSDITSASRYSSSHSSSRSRSRSYSRSLSKSPYRGRQRKSRKRSRSRRRSRSRSRRRRRSYSRSYSRSRTPDRRRGRSDCRQRSLEKRSRDSPKGNKKEIKKASPEDISPSREEDWGHKCDIEFVDSEEDFDDNPEATKKDSGAQKTLPVNRIERASISFSLQKKPIGIAQSVDLDDLPLKKKQMSGVNEDIEPLDAVKPTTKNEEIVISSDSEAEMRASTTKSVTVLRVEEKRQSEQQLPSISTSSSKTVEIKKPDHPSSDENVSLQSDQRNRFIKTCETNDIETKKQERDENSNGTLKSVADLDQQTNSELKSSDDEITQNISDRNIATEREKEAVKCKDKDDIVVTVNKDELSTKDSKNSGNLDDSESSNVDCDDTPKKLSRNTRGDLHKEEQMKNSENLTTEGDNAESAGNCKEKSTVEGLDKEKTQDTDTAKVDKLRVKEAGRMDDAASRRRRRIMTRSQVELHSEKDTKQNIGKKVNAEEKSSNQSLEEEEEDSEVTISNQAAESKHCKEEGVMSCEVEEKMQKGEMLSTDEHKDVEPDDNEVVASIFEGQSEEDFFKGAEQHRFSDDEKDEKGFLKDKTPVESFRTMRKSTRRSVNYSKPSQKIEMVIPERSLMKKDRKKRVKVGSDLGMERTDVSKSAQSEEIISLSQENELETETSENTKAFEVAENEEKQVHSPAVVSDPESSQPAEEPGEQKEACPSPKEDPAEVSYVEDASLRKTDHDTEIIGVIETKDTGDNFDDMELGRSSWSMRWLQSEKVQKVVTSSKMMSRVRKNIQKKEKATKVVQAEKVEETQKPAEPVSVIGSIEEYERLFGTKVRKEDPPSVAGSSESQSAVGEEQAPGSVSLTQDNIPESKSKGNPVFGSDDDGEDSEEEALWSKIIKM